MSTKQHNHTDAAAIAAHLATKGATQCATKTATGGASKQRHTPAPQAANPFTQAMVAPNSLAPVAPVAGAANAMPPVTSRAIVQTAPVAVIAPPVGVKAYAKAHCTKQHIARPTLASLTYISAIVATGPIKGLRPMYWANYQVGITLLHAKLATGLCPLQVQFYAKHGLVTVSQATPGMLAAAVAAWQAGTLPALLNSWVGQNPATLYS